MPRIPRGQTAGYAYHVLNRGNARTQVFHKGEDHEAFLELLAAAKVRHSVKIFAFCLTPNHFHLVLEPSSSTALSQFMQWLLTAMFAATIGTITAADMFGRDVSKVFRSKETNIY